MVLQTVVAELLDAVVGTYGPFVIPVTLFAVGAVGYAVLVALGRAGPSAREVTSTQRPARTPDSEATDERDEQRRED